jgi:ubiquinone/menaquinone biosynthesis C-methylase UbiE
VGFKTIEMGLKNGLLTTLAANSGGLTAAELAAKAGADAFYTGVWARAAYGAELIEVDRAGRYTLAPHMDKLILNEDFPGYVGGIPAVFSCPEVFDSFSANLKSGKRTWWNDMSPAFIEAVSGTGRPFYNRLIPAGLEKVPGLAEKLISGAKVLELGCGVGLGLVKLAGQYPNTEIVGVDGDPHSLEVSRRRVSDAGLSDRVRFVESALEDFAADGEYDLSLINISMHECRDINLVTENVRRALKPGGQFVISDFPFPSDHDGLRAAPARVMTGIQYFEATIDDQLMPTEAFVELLERHNFREVTGFDITPVHNLIHGTK